MAAKQIIPFGDPILRKIAKPADPTTAKIIKLLDDMKDTLYAAEGRAGLAAPQIGILRRVVVMDCGEGLLEMINPEIVAKSDSQTGPEACLSFPGFAGVVERAQAVTVKYKSRAGEEVLLESEGYLARCIQHEVDHLNGILFIDHVEVNWLYHEETNQRVRLLDVRELSWQSERI